MLFCLKFHLIISRQIIKICFSSACLGRLWCLPRWSHLHYPLPPLVFGRQFLIPLFTIRFSYVPLILEFYSPIPPFLRLRFCHVPIFELCLTLISIYLFDPCPVFRRAIFLHFRCRPSQLCLLLSRLCLCPRLPCLLRVWVNLCHLSLFPNLRSHLPPPLLWHLSLPRQAHSPCQTTCGSRALFGITTIFRFFGR
jgi:hypothetical protein